MTITTKSLDELHEIGRGSIRGDIPNADTSSGSDYDISTRMVAAIAMLNQGQAQDLGNQILPADADDEGVERHARARGLTKQGAAAALGKVQVTATADATQPSGSTLTHADGTAFATTEPGVLALPSWSGKTCAADCDVGRLIVTPSVAGMAPDELVSVGGLGGIQRAIKEVIPSISAIDFYEPLPTIPAPGTVISPVRGRAVEIAASVAGRTSNKPIGDTLTLSSPVAGVTPAARIIELGGGGDEETIEELRSRCIDHDANRPGGGNVEHVRQLARETPGVRIADAIVFPCLRGLGTFDVVAIGVEGARVTGASALVPIQARLEAEYPYDADIVVSSVLPTVSEHDVDVSVLPEVGFERDFISAGVAIAAAPASTVSRIELVSSLSGTAEPGDRVLVTQRVGPNWKTLQRKITAIYPFAVEVEPPLPAIPLSTDPVVRPGGPLAESIIAAVEKLFDVLGPSRRNTSPAFTFERHPLPSIAWDDTLSRAQIDATLMALDGVNNVPAITSPATDVQPGALETVRPGRIVVRFLDP